MLFLVESCRIYSWTQKKLLLCKTIIFAELILIQNAKKKIFILQSDFMVW